MDGRIFKSAKGYGRSDPSRWLGIRRWRMAGGSVAAPESGEAAAPWPEGGGGFGERAPVAGTRREDGREREEAMGTSFEASPAAEGDREGVLDGGVARRKEKRGGGALWREGALGECSRRGGGLG